MEPSFVLDTGGAGRISNDSTIIYCSSKSFLEDAEEEEATPAKSVITPLEYDEDAIIAYPGFNVCSSKLRDECHVLQCPSMQKRHLLENFILSLRNSPTNILEASRYKESLESKDLNDLEGERQRLLSEINALRNSLPSTSDHSGSDREKEMRSDFTTIEACFPGEVPQGGAVAESDKEQLELESEEGTAIPSNFTHAIANNSGASDSAGNQRNISCAQEKLPKLEAFSSGIQPFEPYKNLPNAQGAYNRVRNTLKRAKGNPAAFVRSEAQSEEHTRELLMSDGPTSRPELCEEGRGWRSAIPMDSRLNSSSGIESRPQRSSKEKADNQACEMEPVNPPSTAPRGGAKVRLERTQSVAAPMTAEDINEFLAHSDGESSDSSDWNDVKEEAEEGEEVESCRIGGATPCTVSTPSPIPQTARDVEIAKLLDSPRTNVKLTNPQSAETENETILEHGGTWRSGMSEHGLRVGNSLSKIASERHEKRVEGESQRTPCGSEQVANIGPHGHSTNSRRKALQICESRRANVLASLGGSRKGLPSHSSSLSNDEYFVAVPTDIRVMRPQISSELWATRTSNRRVFSLSQYVREAAGSGGLSLQTETTVLVGVIGSKMPPHRSRNNKIFSIWRLTDLMSVGTGAPNGHNINLFLFGAVHEKLWKEPEGTVVAILKPKLLPPNENSNLTSTNGTVLSITVDSAPFVMLLGMSLDFALCAATTKVGRPCSRIVNKNACRYCDLHVKTAYYSASSMRPGFATTLFSKPGYCQRRGSKRLSGDASDRGFLLHHPTSMPIDRGQDTRSLNRLAVSSGSAGNAVHQSPSSLSTASRTSFQATPSELKVSFASPLNRPTQGSLNLLRHLEATSASPLTLPESSVKSKYLKNAKSQANSHETFATFFAGVKNKTLAQKPRIGRGLEVGTRDDHFIDLGPVSAKDSKLNASLMVLPSSDAARRRAEALVQIKGGIGALHQSAREQTQKRILDMVSQSTSKKPKPSPLTQILDSVSSLKMNKNRKQESTERTPKSSDTLMSEKREELARLVSQGSCHADIAAANEASAEQKLLSRLEARDSIEQVLLNQHEQECQIVTCLRERKGPKLAGEKLLIRGIEEKYLS
ncbi:unnamed protein product [Taenia asiatica]|uniref:Protein MCM10 homolog n=1 Tax=Taenia asiatica TaxID=60517 RepID=A0A0R3WEJ2_TAEAS|nr:unnamed protein product [Taenia asiatica]